MRVHLYEFRSGNRKLTCSCGWQRTVKSLDPVAARKAFEQHCRDAAAESR